MSVTLPRQLLRSLGFAAGASVSVTLEGGRMVLSPTRPRYTLDQLLEGMKPGDVPAALGWSDVQPVAREVWQAAVASTRRASFVPKRGDPIRLDFDPSTGHEQQGTRPALVLPPQAFNAFGMALACPVTSGGSFAPGQAWAVPLAGAGLLTEGVVLCNRVRMVNRKACRAQFVEAVPPDLIGDVLARVAKLIE